MVTPYTSADTSNTPSDTQALVSSWTSQITEAKAHFDKDFKRMRQNMRIARGEQWQEGSDAYVANLVHRQIKRGTASIYAKNPTAVARRRRRMEFTVWDGNPQSLAMAQQVLATMGPVAQAAGAEQALGGMVPPEAAQIMQQVMQAQAVIQDAQQGLERMKMYERMGKTLELMFSYSLNEPRPIFKQQAKQLIRRVRTCGVGYAKVGYQKILTRGPDVDARIRDVSDQMAEIERLLNDAESGDLAARESEQAELRYLLETFNAQPEKVAREGLIFDFPKSTAIIVDPACTQLKGFVGAKWIAQEMMFSPEDVKRIYGADIGKRFTGYSKQGLKYGQVSAASPGQARPLKDMSLAAVWEVYDLERQLMFTVCDGYPDFLKSPGEPAIWTEHFHPFFALSFNDIEDDETIYPPSDVDLILHQQLEYNRARQSLREHRYGNRPAWVVPKGAFGGEAKTRIADHEIYEAIELEVPMTGDVDVRKLLQPKPVQPIDPATYEVEHLFTDMQRVIGEQEANFGGTSDSTATEATIAEQSRATGLQSEADELDEFLSDFARTAGQVLLLNMEAETVKNIVGPGAVWPEFSRQEAAQEIYLEVRAGSSGRPNRAVKLANIERVTPYLIQIPGVNPAWLAKKLLNEMDDDIDLDEAVAEGIPSITAINGMAQPAQGPEGEDPNAQGGKGGDNQEKPQERQAGPQPAMDQQAPQPGVGPPGMLQ